MALETLNGIHEIGGFKVLQSIMDSEQLARDDKTRFIEVCRSNNTIIFRIQDGPIKDNGVNGCQIDTMLHVARLILLGLNKNFPCKENDEAIHHLDQAIYALENRKKDREKRGVEGQSLP